jgi:hypothetical protein
MAGNEENDGSGIERGSERFPSEGKKGFRFNFERIKKYFAAERNSLHYTCETRSLRKLFV